MTMPNDQILDFNINGRFNSCKYAIEGITHSGSINPGVPLTSNIGGFPNLNIK